MAKKCNQLDKDQFDKLKQIIKLMEEHNIIKFKKDGFHIERGKPEAAVDLAQRKEMDKKTAAEARRIAEIRVRCPYPCPHWQSAKKGAVGGIGQ